MKSQMTRYNMRNGERGQVVMIAVFVFLALSLAVIIGISVPISAQVRNSNAVLQTKKSLVAADVLNEEVLYRLNTGNPLPSTIILSLNSGTSSATISDVGSAKQIIANGVSGSYQRNAKAIYTQGGGLSLTFGLQVGNGGLQMSGGPTIYGGVYANGNIVASGGSTITGNTVAASVYELDTEVENFTSGTTTPTHTQPVGLTSGVRRVAQSFTVSTSTPVTSFDLFVKKTGAPANATLRIYNNSGTSVGSTQIGGSGSLSASLVNAYTFTWVKVYPLAPISLTPGTVYWVTVEYNGNNSNYYRFAANDNGYAGGDMKVKNSSGSYFNPTPSTMDMWFKVYMGGLSTISGITIQGFANAGIVNSSTINNALYCQNGTSNNKACDTSQALPSPLPFPISTATIDAWKSSASGGTVRSSWTISGATATTTSGPMRINGNLTVTAGGSLTLGGPLYVTGTITVSGGAYIALSSSYGAGDEKIIGQYVRLTGGGQIRGNGTAGNYIIVVADGPDCSPACSGSNYSIAASGGTGSVVLIAPNGTIEFIGGTSAKSAVAQRMIMSGGTILNFEAGLTNLSFSTGSSTNWNVESWKEIE